jgi:hypothetical protein
MSEVPERGNPDTMTISFSTRGLDSSLVQS